jgi:hypothetical protein
MYLDGNILRLSITGDTGNPKKELLAHTQAGHSIPFLA